MSHDFVELPDGGVAWIAADWRKRDGQWIRGNRVMERDASGVLREVTSVWDHLELDIDQVDQATGWTHANALDYLPEEDAYLLGLRNLHTVLWIERSSGEMRWSFGGAQSDFAFLGSGQLPYHPHQFQWVDDGLLLFDNRSSDERASRVVEYALDLERMDCLLYTSPSPRDRG